MLFWAHFFKHVGEGWVHASFRDYVEKCEVFIFLVYLPGALPWMRLDFAALFLEALTNYVQLIHY